MGSHWQPVVTAIYDLLDTKSIFKKKKKGWIQLQYMRMAITRKFWNLDAHKYYF